MNRRKQKINQLVQTAGLESQIGEAQTFGTLMRRMVRENKLAVVSFCVIILFILAAVFAPLLTPYTYDEMDLTNLEGCLRKGGNHKRGMEQVRRGMEQSGAGSCYHQFYD